MKIHSGERLAKRSPTCSLRKNKSWLEFGMMKCRVILIGLLVIGVVAFHAASGAMALFSDTEQSASNTFQAWVSQLWTQTTQADFASGTSVQTDTTSSPGDVLLSLVSNPTLVTSDNTEVSTSSLIEWELVKTLTFDKTDSSYDEIRIDSNIRVSDSSFTVQSSIRIDDVEQFTHSTTSTVYEGYSDILDFSGYPNGQHTVRLYLKIDGGTDYNSLFELYRTSPTLVTSDNSEVSASGDTEWHLVKTLTFTKDGADYNQLRIDSDLRTDHSNFPVSSSIQVDDVEKFTHSTTSTTYENYSDTLDFSGYADGEHTVKLYLKADHKNQPAYNSTFELYRTNPTLITSDNSEVSITYDADWQLVKTLSFNKDSATYDELRIDSNLKADHSGFEVYSSIRVDDVEQFAHSTTSTVYESYSDVLDFSGYADGEHTVKLYLGTSNKAKPAYNSVFELYRTKTYASSGTIASQVYDTGIAGARWDTLSWSETLDTSTNITFEVRASDTEFQKDDGTPAWVDLGSTNSPIETGLPIGRYIQWRATLTTSEQHQTPILHEVTVEYY